MATSPAGTCTNFNVAYSTKSSDILAFVSTTAYPVATLVTGSATNSVVIQTAGTSTQTRHTFTAQLGYVTGSAFTAFTGGTAQTYALTSTTAYRWAPNFTTWSGTVPAGSFLAVKVSATSTTASTATVYFGTSVAGLGVASGTFTVTESSVGTAAGAATAAQTTGATPSIAVSAPYTYDANANNTLSYRYRLSGGTYGSSTALAHAASPYALTLSGLTCGSSYDVEVTYADADGVAGTAVQTLSGVPLTNCTAAGPATAAQTTGATPSIAVSAPYTGDANGNGTLSYRSRLSGGTYGSSTALAHAASPYAFTLSGLTCGSSYDVEVTYADPDAVGGTAVQTISGVALTNCTTTGAVTLDGTKCGQATASAAFTGDADGDGTTAFARGPSATGPWTATSCTVVGGVSPRACVDAPAPGTYWYRATFADGDGVGGTNPVVSGASVAVTACPVLSTTVGAVSATAAGTSLAPALAISAAYSDDANASNTLSYRTRTPSGTGTWSGATTVAHAASPYAVNAAAACGSSYDVEVSFVDTDGVTGTNPTTISSLQTAACPTIALGDASAGEAATTLAPGAGSVALDAFTLQTSAGVVAPSSITVTMPSGSAPLVAQLTLEDSQACDHLTAHATISSPATDTPTFSGISGVPINSSSPTTLWVCLTPKTHAAMPPPPGSQVAVTGQVTGVVASGYVTTGSDVPGAPRTIDNLSPAAPGAFTGTLSGTTVSLAWTNAADAAQTIVLRWNGSTAGAEVPLEGKAPDYAVGDTVGTATIACVVNAPATSCTDATLVGGTTYAYASFSRDANLNWSLGAASTPASFTPAAGPASTTLVSSSDPAGARICPGATAYVDRFGFAVSGANDTIGTLTLQGLGASAPLASIELRDDTGAPLSSARTGTPFGDTYLFGSANLPAPIGTTFYRLYVTVRPWDALPAGELPLQPTVQSFGSNNAPAGTDAASGFVVDHAPPAQVTWDAVTPGAGTIQLAWTNPTDATLQRVFVLRRAATAPFTETFAGGSAVPAQGTTTAGGSYVVWSGSATSEGFVTVTDTTVQAGTTYEYRIYAVDACGNFNDGAPGGPYAPSGPFVAEGSTTPGAPMISIVNPQKGNVASGTFRVQIRVYNPAAQGGIAGLTAGSLAYSLDDGATWATAGIAALTGYDTSTSGTLTGRTFEVTLSPAAGNYTLRARVSNGVAAGVRSNAVPVTAVAQGGDGRLLVRDNSAQLCSDCHAGHAHTSESTQSAKGSWSTTCRDCHTPHGTRNLGLVAEQITPPGITGPSAPKTVTFYNKAGAAPDSYANATNTGVCQVCHTQTSYYRADGSSPGGTHETAQCTACHAHGNGLVASCTACHGTDGRASIAGADGKQSAAPPRVASGAAVFVANGGAHLAHVNQVTWRSAPLACAACHTIPNTHQTPSQTDVAWSALASAGGVAVQPPTGAITTTWTASPSCTNWCHGAGLAGGGGTNATTPPLWTDAAAPCGSCHASPPPVDGRPEADHPQNTACASCHGGDYAQGSIGPTSKATHVDGTVQKPDNGCTACHGTLAGPAGAPVASTSPNAAPGYDPGVGAVGVDTHATSDRTVASVGAHDRHVDPAMMTPRSCGACHGATPPDGDTTHADGAVAIGFTAPAAAGGVTPAPAAFTSAWAASPTCTNYCHSSGKPIGQPVTTAAPVWTSTARMTCTSCHGNAATLATNAHPKHAATYGIGCQACHAGTTDDGANIVLGGGLHVDGTNSVRFTATDPLWSPLVQGGAYDSAAYTCSSTYCHSNGTSSGAPFPAPVGGALAWTGTTTCTSCHGGPSGAVVEMGVGAGNGSPKHANHVDNAAVIGTNYFCGDCHQATVAAGTNATFSNRANHVDGKKTVSIASRGSFASADTTGTCGATYCHSSGQATPAYVTPAPTWTDGAWTTVCNQCHGRTNAVGAPDYANGGPGAATANSHAKHTASGTDATTCQRCHAGTVTAAGGAILVGSALHTNGARDVGVLAAYGSSAAYDPSTKTCSSVSCHGTKTAQWGATLGCTGCHGDATRTSIAGADANQQGAPPVGLGGETASATRAVGAHVPHVNQGTLRTAPLPCSECHLNATHNGVKEVAFGTLATTGGATPTWNGATCASTYCHAPGGTNAAWGGTILAPSWTGGSTQDACGTCHGSPPPVGGGVAGADHPQNATCSSCHGAGYATTGITGAALATHLDKTVQKPANGCTACHGVLAGLGGAAVTTNTDPSIAPGYVGTTTGQDTTGSSSAASPKVGAHDGHLRPAGGLNSVTPIACSNCHGALPASGDTTHANGTIALSWSTLATGGGTVTPTPSAFGSGWEPTATCTNYCHSNASPAGGTLSTPAFTWTSTTAMTCTSCHSNAGRDVSGVATDLSGKHGKHLAATTYAFKCDECHAATMANDSSTVIGTAANHVNGTKNVAFSTTLLTTGIDQSGGSYASATCSSTYCHSNGTTTVAPFGAPVGTALAWTTGTSACTSCHGGPSGAAVVMGNGAGNGSPKHLNHVSNAAVIGTNFVCADCHAATVSSGNAPVTTFAKHVNGVKDVSIATRGTFASSEPYTGGSCSATYCHSSGQATPAYRTIAWTGSFTTVCAGCHGTTNTVGAPDYANGGAGAATANSHAKHTSNGTDATTCQNCHASTVTAAGTAIASGSTLHVNGARDVVFLSTYSNGGTAGYNSSTKTCSSVSCHGSGTPQWGGTVTCTSCHGTTGTETDDLGVSFWNNGVTATINTTQWAYSGHGKASGTYDVTGNPAAAFPTAPVAGTSECLYCHDDTVSHQLSTNPFRLRGVTDANGVSAAYGTTTTAAANAPCLNCHQTGANGVDPDGTGASYTKKTATKLPGASHDGTKHTAATQGGKFCWDCHDPHGDRANATTGNVAMIAANVMSTTDGTYGYLGASGVSRAVTYTAYATGTSPQGNAVELVTAAGTQHVGLCQACHDVTNPAASPSTAWTKYWNRFGYDDPTYSGTGNSTTYVTSAHNASSTSTPYCASCHPHTAKFAASESGGGTACDSCHPNVLSAMTSGTHYHKLVSAATGYPNAAPTSATDTNRKCLECHVDHDIFRPDLNANGGRGKNLRTDIALTPTTAANFGNKDFDATLANGGICTSCHKASMTRGSTDAYATGGTAVVSNSAFSGSAHTYSGTSTTATFGGTLTNTMIGDCAKCHVDTQAKAYQTGFAQGVHGSTLAAMNENMGVASPTDPMEEAVCYQCHRNTTDTLPSGWTNKPAANRDWYNLQPMSPASQRVFAIMGAGSGTTSYGFKHDVAGKTGLHKAGTAEGAAANDGTLYGTSGANRHVECQDCHDPHGAQPIVPSAQRGTLASAVSAAAGTATTVTDVSAKGWTTNTWVGYTFEAVGGTGAGATGTIIGNGGNTLTVSFTAAASLDATTTYAILPTGTTNGNAIGGTMSGAWGLSPTFPNPPATPPAWNDSAGAPTNAVDLSTQYTAITAWGRTSPTSPPTIQGQVCIKCHSGYAYSATPPNTPSGLGTTANNVWGNGAGGAMPQSDLANQFNPNNLAHHAVFARGKNQPLVSSATVTSTYNTSWPKFNTATVTTTACATAPCTVTFSAALPTNTLPGWFLYIGSSAPAQNVAGWYEVVKVTSGTTLTVDRATTAASAQASFLTAGLGNTFVPPWGPWSTLQCTDCHASDTASDPFGPHGSGTKWLLKKNGNPAFLALGTAGVTAIQAESAVNTSWDVNNLCLNCHRYDVYGDFNWVSPANAGYSRQSHPCDTTSGQAYGTKPKWGIVCMNCHGGARAGTIHGTNLGLGTGSQGTGASNSGKRLLAGAFWSGVTRSGATTGSCFTKGRSTDSVNNCSNTSAGAFRTGANYRYDDTTP